MIRFKKIDYNQFKNEVKDDKDLYDNFIIPKKEYAYSADYYFYAPYEINLPPFAISYIPTCVYPIMEEADRLIFFPLKNTKIRRTVSDTSLNELRRMINLEQERKHHIFIRVENITNKNVRYKKGEAICTATFGKVIKQSKTTNIDIYSYDKI